MNRKREFQSVSGKSRVGESDGMDNLDGIGMHQILSPLSLVTSALYSS